MTGLFHKEAAPVSVKSGPYEFLKLNASGYELRDIYHWMLTLSWPRFSAFIFAVYMAINLFFALLYYLGKDCIGEMPSGSFGNAFFFSVETLATVGYGHMYPANWYGHVVTTVEIMTGMFGLAVMTGLIFVRFSRPTARVLFSRTAVVAPYDGVPALMFRVGNMRHQALVEVEFRLMMLRNEITAEGEEFRRFHPLTLQFDRLIVFPAAVTVRHIIDETSPLHGMTPEQWMERDVRFVASVVGVDTVIQTSVQSQNSFASEDVRFGHRFVEIYTDVGVRRLEVDYGRLHETEPIEPATLDRP